MNEEITKKIELLIEQENNPVERSKLMLLLQMSAVISDAVKTNAEVIDKLKNTDDKVDTHIVQYRRASDQYRGAKKIMAALFIVAQAGLGYLTYQVIDAPRRNTEAIIQLDKRLAVLETRITK